MSRVSGVKGLFTVVKLSSLFILGPIFFWGSLGLVARGGLLRCPFPLPFLMCSICPVFCTYGSIRSFLFLGITGGGFVMGRVFCGLFCPAGVLQEFISKLSIAKLSLPLKLDTFLKSIKYLAIILVVGVFLKSVPAGVKFPFIDELWIFLGQNFKEVRIFLLIFLGVLLFAVLFAGRIWCKYLCPLGAWSGVFNRFSLFKLCLQEKKCKSCQKCAQACSVALNPLKEGDLNSLECVRCFNCYNECDERAIRIKPVFSQGRVEPNNGREGEML